MAQTLMSRQTGPNPDKNFDSEYANASFSTLKWQLSNGLGHPGGSG
jgi:hypothetical protein